MLFTQKEFVVFIGIVLSFCIVVRNHRAQKVFLLVASYYFYAYWDWRFLSLVMLITVVDFTIGQILSRVTHPRKRKFLVVFSVCVSLTILGFFKYYNFFIVSLSPILLSVGLNVHTLSIILPIGISFYTFQSMSYTIDVYRKHIPACSDFLDFALAVAFFPQILSGPIVRGRDFLPQLASARQLSWERGHLGTQQFIYGLFKKVFIADRLAQFIDPVFQAPGVFDAATLWLAAASYSVQIYCDFSGYSDMAIGIARVLGYDFKQNFDWPYLSRSIDEFWRRWHISLSSWLRDYLYISLGGNRYGKFNTYRNLMLTMLLGGLWHGASWTFVVWGGLHGLALVVTRAFREMDMKARERRLVSVPLALAGRWLTLLVILLGWVLFRAHTFHDAATMILRMFSGASGVSWLPPFVLVVFAGTVALHCIRNNCASDDLPLKPDKWYTAYVLVLLILLVLIFYPSGFHPFIYFQF